LSKIKQMAELTTCFLRSIEKGYEMATGFNQPSRQAIVPAAWAAFYAETSIPAAVRVNETLRLTGHTGEAANGVFSSDAETQIRQVFHNIELTLAEAGARWADVVEINSFHVGLATQATALLRVAAQFLEDPYPAWTAVGVTELIIPEAVVEISCVAVFFNQGE
jgi:enamine deaminase RidA (YjgF/YER057c/UK114 family)